LEEPSIEDLTAQLQVVQQWLQGIVMYDGDLDVDLAEDDDVIFELHKKLVEGI
jgi:chaperonin cofactor prefoldin